MSNVKFNDVNKLIERINYDIENKDKYVYSNFLMLMELLLKYKYDDEYTNITDLINLFSNEFKNIKKENLHLIRTRGNSMKHSKIKPDFNVSEVNNCKSTIDEMLKIIINKKYDDLVVFDFDKEKGKKVSKSNDIVIKSYGNTIGDGIVIRGLKELDTLSFYSNSVLGVVYNILTLFKTPKTTTFINDKEKELGLELKSNLTIIRNYELILLLLMKNGYFNSEKEIQISVDKNEFLYLQIAFEEIMYYSKLICKLTKREDSYFDKILVFNPKGFKIFDKIKYDIYDPLIQVEKNFVWVANDLKYDIDIKKDEETMKIFLIDIFGFNDFRDGQFVDISLLLNSTENTLSILPTGSGKSLVFYFSSIMKNSNTLIITPTDILIEDQLRNLEVFFGIKNAYAIYSESDIVDDLSSYKMIYISSSNMLDNSINQYINKMNSKWPISQIIIDEVHTISNWSHDFRPEFMMLSTFLINDFKNANIHAFTATAPYKVTSDLCFQLSIPVKNVFCLNTNVKDNIVFSFLETNDEQNSLKDILENSELDNSFDKTVVFFHDDKFLSYHSDKLVNKISIIREKGTVNYSDFVDGDKSILLAKSELGIGINIPNIKNVIHCNMPFSLSEYIQEIGRALRREDNWLAKSTVLVPSFDSMTKTDLRIINRDISTEEIITLVNDDNNKDKLIKILKHLLINEIQDIQLSTDLTYKMYEVLRDNITAGNSGGLRLGKKVKIIYLYVLVIFGFVQKWTFDNTDYLGIQHVKTRIRDGFNSNVAKENLRKFFIGVKTSEKYIQELDNINDFKKLIEHYYRWWRDECVYFSVEQLIESYNFFVRGYSESEIISVLENNLELNIKDINKLEIDLFKKVNYENVFDLSQSRISKIRNHVYQLSSVKEEPIIDLTLFVSSLYESNLEFSRLDRALKNIKEENKGIILNKLSVVYNKLHDNKDKLKFIDICSNYFGIKSVLNAVFKDYKQDDIAYVARLIALQKLLII